VALADFILDMVVHVLLCQWDIAYSFLAMSQVLGCLFQVIVVDNEVTEVPFIAFGRPTKAWIIGLTRFGTKGIKRC